MFEVGVSIPLAIGELARISPHDWKQAIRADNSALRGLKRWGAGTMEKGITTQARIYASAFGAYILFSAVYTYVGLKYSCAQALSASYLFAGSIVINFLLFRKRFLTTVRNGLFALLLMAISSIAWIYVIVAVVTVVSYSLGLLIG